jgi:hypothetical protein
MDDDDKDLFCSQGAVIVVAREWRTVVGAIVSYIDWHNSTLHYYFSYLDAGASRDKRKNRH